MPHRVTITMLWIIRRFTSLISCAVAILLWFILLTESGKAQWEEIGLRSEPLTKAEFVCADGLYMNDNDSVYRYDRSTYTWIPLFKGRLLATNDSSMLYMANDGALMFTDNLGRTSQPVDRPNTVIVKYYVHKRSVVLLDHNNYLFVTPEVGRIPFSKTVNFLSRPLNQYDIKVHWYDSLIIAHHNDYRQLYVLTMDSIPSSRATDELDNWLTSVSSSHGHTLFNYNGRISFTRGDRSSERTLQTPHSSTGLAVHGSKIIVFASDGTQYVTRDTGLTWEISHILPNISIPRLTSFVFGDSLYVYNDSYSEYYASDSSLSRWWLVSGGNPLRQAPITHSIDTLFFWYNYGCVTVWPLHRPTQRPETRHSHFKNVIAGFTVADGSMVIFEDQRMFRTLDGGLSWDTTVFERTSLLAGYSGGYLWRLDGHLHVSTDDGYTWQQTASGYDTIPPTSFACHNGTYIIMRSGKLDIHTPENSFLETDPPWMIHMPSFASFNGRYFVITKNNSLYEFMDGKWFLRANDSDIYNGGSFVPNDNYYYGVTWDDRPVRVNGSLLLENISLDRFPGPLIRFSGPYVFYASPITGAFIYTPDDGTTSEGTSTQDSLRDSHSRIFHDNVIDLSDYQSYSSTPPSVSIHSLTGACVLRQEGVWTIHTNQLSPGVYIVVVDGHVKSTTSLIYVMDD